MQSLNWYIRRLQSMTLAEMVWRARGLARGAADRAMYRRRMQPLSIDHFCDPVPGNSLPYGDSRAVVPTDRTPREAADQSPGTPDSPHALRADPAGLIERAEAILRGEIHLLGMSPTQIGERIDWNREYRSGKATPTVFAAAIDYRDFSVTGDCKWVWELSRHHHLVVLGRAYAASGDRRYALAVASQLKSWLDQCPFGCGMNWRSPLELAIRLINWVWAIELIRPAEVIDATLGRQISESVYRHLWDVSRKYSRFSSANNHLIGEAAGVFIGASYFSWLRGAATWRSEARQILIGEMASQTHEDGGHREQATGYQLFVMQFFTLAGVVGRRTDGAFPASYWNRLERMYEFIGSLLEGGPMPLWGDCDDGYVLDLGEDRHDPREWLAVGASIFDRADLASAADRATGTVKTLLGESAATSVIRMAESHSKSAQSKAFTRTGIYLLQRTRDTAGPALSLTFDAGELGFGTIAAHGHADALSFTLRINGANFVVDPGTFDYFTHPDWRNHFRGTAAHNTIEIDGQNQSELLGSFLWGRRATTKLIDWSSDNLRTGVAAEHDGYCRLMHPAIHRRSVRLDTESASIELVDEIIGNDRHRVRQYFHFAPECRVFTVNPHLIRLVRPEGELDIALDPATSVSLFVGDPRTKLGFVSRRYHDRAVSTTLVAGCESNRGVRITTRMWAYCPNRGRSRISDGDPEYNRHYGFEGIQERSASTKITP
ncbi:MAG: alginate lyase family protein [Phycisphaerae bacterium]|nr:alginate lyase family protein [Phycisphaerae bacterium]